LTLLKAAFGILCVGAFVSFGFGLLGVRERARILGGTATWTRGPGEGSALLVEVPA